MGNITDDDRRRMKRCVCKQCGGELKMKVVVYDPYGGHDVEMICEHCHKIEYGTEKEIYNLASKFIDEIQFNYFLDMEENERSELLNTAKVCEMFSWLLGEIGLIGDDGIKRDTPATFE